MKKLRRSRASVWRFVGDGINDAPALEQADLGVAVSRASGYRARGKDIILLNSDLDSALHRGAQVGAGHLAHHQTEFVLGFLL